MELITTDAVANVGVITLNNDKKRNALSHQLVEETLAAFDQFTRNKIRAVVLRAKSGAQTWSAGHDVRELPDSRRDPLSWNDPLVALVRRIIEYPAPVIALVEGGVWGGACELALSCDMVVAVPDATFAITPAKLGVPYNMSGLLHFLNKIPLAILNEMAFTAKPITAERAERIGFVNHVVERYDITRFTLELAEQIAGNSPLTVAAMKESLRLLAGAHALTPDRFERIQGLRRKVWDSADYKEGIHAFLERRPPVFRGE